MLDGVYWQNGGVPPTDNGGEAVASQPDVNSVSTGLYALLSAELCKVTGTTSYCDRAYKSMRWIDDHMLNPANNLLWDHLNATNCALSDYTFTCES